MPPGGGRIGRDPQHRAAGAAIRAARLAAGMDVPALAAILRRRPATVADWETGKTAPSLATIRGIALAFGIDAAALSGNADESSSSPVALASLGQALPTDRLDQVAFERFVAAMLSKRHPGAVVRRAGESGHEQGGLDVTVRWPDGTLHSYQCKRVARFGPADVVAAVAAHAKAADVKHLVISRTASPQAADALTSFPGWIMLDREDLSRIVHLELSHDDQDRLIDVFFPGMRMPLLGRSEASQWLTTTEYFAPFIQPDAVISHGLPLQGREAEAALLRACLADPGDGTAFLVGPGGGGKSRLLLHVLGEFEFRNPGTTVRFLSAAGTGGRRAGLEALGRRPKVLVVDDAHDRDADDLLGLFEHAAAPGSTTRLVLAARPYAAARIAREAARFSLKPCRIDLGQLGEDQAGALARAALSAAGAAAEASWEQVAQAAGECPLILVMAARIVARQGSSAGLATAGDGFRDAVLGRFADVMAGDLGSEVDRDALRRVLAVLAIVQPFHVDDARLYDLVERTERVASVDVPRLLRLLEEGGVVYRRGGVHRLMPDVLADYIIEDAYVGPGGRLAPKADRMLAEAPAGLVENVLVNLGRLDWRLTDGATAGSRLLESAWGTLEAISDEYDPRLAAVRAVAYYQPRQALRFVRRRTEEGRGCREAAAILRRVAYDYDSLDEACDLLWRLGAHDERELGPHPDHPIRALVELCGYEDGKPLAYSERVFRWALGRMGDADAWDRPHTPLEVAAAVLGTEVIKTTSDDRQVIMSAFIMNPEAVRPLRRELIDLLLGMLADARSQVGCRAAAVLGTALQHPIGMLGNAVPDVITAAYDVEFEATLALLRDAVLRGLHPAVAIAVMRAVNWHAEHGRSATRLPARAVLDAMPTDLRFRTMQALADGFGQLALGPFDPTDWSARTNEWLAGLTAELHGTYRDASELVLFIEAALDDLSVSPKPENSAHMLQGALIRGNLDFTRELVATVGERPHCRLWPSAATALGFLLDREPDEGRAIAAAWLEDAGLQLPVAAARAFSLLPRPPADADIKLIGSALRSGRSEVVGAALQAMSSWRFAEPRLSIGLLAATRVGDEVGLADLLALVLCHGPGGLMDELDVDDARGILRLLLPVPRLEGHWISELMVGLSSRFTGELANFLMERVEIAANDRTSGYRPIGHALHDRAKLDFLCRSDGPAVLARCWDWLLSSLDRSDPHFAYDAQIVFEAMFLSDPQGRLTSFFAERFGQATGRELGMMGQVLRHAHPGFVFDHLGFVEDFLECCAAAGTDVFRAARDNLFLSATMGSRSSIVGQPCARDIDALTRSEAALRSVPLHSRAADLLGRIRRDAEERVRDRASPPSRN
jgi:transcriptional regulator with XRE-family HTH domain